MNPKGVRKDEQIKLIMECRRSGLSDYQWCKANGIHPGNFYNWVSKLKKSGYTFPDSESKNASVSVKPEVVKLSVVDDEIPSPSIVEQNTSSRTAHTIPSVAVEMQLGAITLRLYNGADSEVIQSVLKCIGGVSHAW